MIKKGVGQVERERKQNRRKGREAGGKCRWGEGRPVGKVLKEAGKWDKLKYSGLHGSFPESGLSVSPCVKNPP